jgi:fumarylacetoacetase
MLDETHAQSLRSWVESANDATTDFPIQNLPFGVFRRVGTHDDARVGVAIGNEIVDLAACESEGLLVVEASIAEQCRAPSLNGLMSLGRPAATALRRSLVALLRSDSEVPVRDATVASRILVRAASAQMLLPADIGDYTDFYASIEHATNVGSMFRPDSPLLPNYKWVPIGYHGRASSIVVSGTDVRRPHGQTREGNEGSPNFGPSKRLDYELEIGAFIASGNALGFPIPLHDAEQHIFGLCLVNDWSARDIQAWEYQPLGPFLAKNFATTISPWVVTLDALEPFRAPARVRDAGDPLPLPYLSSEENQASGAFAITLEVALQTPRMRETGIDPHRVSVGTFSDMYWTLAQLVSHHASGGCNLGAGDLLASGTVSGATKESRGCLLERTWRGTEPLELPTGETRAFLADGDVVVMRGYCERPGARRIGFGECRGEIVPATAGTPRNIKR